MGKLLSKYTTGGSIEQNEILSKIKTIGFEFETNQMTHFSIRGDELHNVSNRSNIDGTSKVEAIDILSQYALTEIIGGSNILGIEGYDYSVISPNIYAIYDTPLIGTTSPIYSLNPPDDIIYSDAPKIFTLTDSSKAVLYKINPPIIGSRYKQFKHTEIIFTFKSHIIHDNNIIYHYLLFAYIYMNFIISEPSTNVYNLNYNNKQLSNNVILYQLNSHIIANPLIFMIPNKKKKNTINTINWVIQVTLGIKLEYMLEVLLYLNMVESQAYKSMFEYIYEIGNIIMNNFILTELYLSISDTITEIQLKKLTAFIIIFIYTFHNYELKISFMYDDDTDTYGNDNPQIDALYIHKKQNTFVFRHTIFSMSKLIDEQLFHNFLEYLILDKTDLNGIIDNYLIIEIQKIPQNKLEMSKLPQFFQKYKSLYQIFYDLFDPSIAIYEPHYNRIQKDYYQKNRLIQYQIPKKWKEITYESTFYPIDKENEILLVEFRSLYALLDIEKNKLGNYPKGVITLAQLKSILENKLSISIP